MSNNNADVATIRYRGHGPAMIDEWDDCDHCESQISRGRSVHRVETAPGDDIEQWCRQCAAEVRQRV